MRLNSNKHFRGQSLPAILIAFLITATTLILGHISFGFWTMLIFSSGFLGGFVLWLLFPTATPYAKLRAPYWSALVLFLAHRVEEKVAGFFKFLSEITDVPTPEVTSWNVISLVVISAGAWLSIPWLLKRKNELGYYLAWTFFAAMGITELAHWAVFPFLVEDTYRYIPGMGSVVLLAPAGWWGLRNLVRGAQA